MATTDYQALIAGGYKELFAGLNYRETGLEIRDQVRAYIGDHSPVAASRDGRITTAATALPQTGEAPLDPLAIAGLGVVVLAGGLFLRRRAMEPR